MKNNGSLPSPLGTTLFIMSEGRSGSTWLAYVLGSHSWAATVGEYYIPWSEEKLPVCNYCVARGFSDCQILRGIESIDQNQALQFAFERLKKPVIVENSKKRKWLSQFNSCSLYSVRPLHLLRDPRGWYASQKRRYSFDVSTGMKRWLKSNQEIEADLKSRATTELPRLPSFFYDDLVNRPEIYLANLCQELGYSFEPEALEYWKFPHHGPAGNGAFFNIAERTTDAPITTGDDAFYASQKQQHFYDVRWKSQLSLEEINSIETYPEVVTYLAAHNKDFSSFDRYIESVANR